MIFQRAKLLQKMKNKQIKLKETCEKELENIYKEVDKETSLHKVRCNACGICCNFKRFDHVLFANILEVEYIIASMERPLTRLDDGICPFQDKNRCSVHKHRTLGCRVFFCDKTYKRDFAPDIYNKYYQKIKGLTLKYERAWDYKPFLEHLKMVYS